MVFYYLEYTLLFFLILVNVVIFFWKRNFDKNHSLIYYFILGSTANEILLYVSAYIFKNNVLIYNIFGTFEFLILLYFYYRYTTPSISKKIFISVFISFATVFLTELLFKSPFVVTNYSFLFTNVSLVVFSTYSFRIIINKTPTQLISDYSYFWINCAVVVYYSCTLIIFGLVRLSGTYSVFNTVSRLLLYFFILIYYSLLAVGLWKASKKQTS